MLHRALGIHAALFLACSAALAQDSGLPDRLVVTYVSEGARLAGDVRALEASLGARSERPTSFPASFVYELPAGVDAELAAERFAGLPGVRRADVDRVCGLPSPAPQGGAAGSSLVRECLPNDPLFPQQWPLKNTGQHDGTVDADIDAPEGWCFATDARAVIVAVSDTGIDVTHPELADQLWTNEPELNGSPGIDDDGNGYVDDVHGFDFVHATRIGGLWYETEDPPNGPFDDHYHGTASAGTIGAHGDNAIGLAGVAWRARIMAVKAMNELGQGYTSIIRDSVKYAVDNGARVINCSWVATFDSGLLRDAIVYARDHGVLCITAAGNSWANIDEDPGSGGYPGAYDYENQVTVASTDVDDYIVGTGPKVWGYGSNWGPLSVQLAAPGVLGVTTEPLWRGNGGYRFTWSGTSMAMPHVVGMAALAWAQDPGQDFTTVRRRVVDAVDCKPQVDGYLESGGRANLHHLLRTDDGPPGPIDDLSATPLWFDRARVRWHETGEDGPFGLPPSCYDLRFATVPIAPEDFDLATPAIGEPQPAISTGVANGVVTGLAPDTTYWFLMKVRDHHGNEVLSNQSSMHTMARPRVDDLQVTGAGVGFVDLGFTLPDVPAISIQPLFTAIDLRRSSQPIDESNFAEATPVDGEPPIQSGVTAYAVHVDGLELDTQYWFALVLEDVYGQTTLVSNTVAGTSHGLALVAFSDDMESGSGGWVSDGNWALTDEAAHSGSFSWTDSPGGNYPPNREAILVSPSIDLGGLSSAALVFEEIFNPNLGESVFVEASASSGPWELLAQIDIYEQHTDWRPRVIDATAFAGETDVRLRFRFVSNGLYQADGWYVDDVVVGGD